MPELIGVLVGGFLGSAHCVGMCGGFAATIGASGGRFGPLLARQLIYNLGRIFTYAFLGAVAGAAGLYLAPLKTPLMTAQQALSILAGLIMVLVGGSVLGVVRLPVGRASSQESLLSVAFKQFLNARGWLGAFLAGLATGFLPCGLVYCFLAMAASTADVTKAMLLMMFFGLGTVPAMVFVGCGSTILSHALRMRVYRMAACLVIILGLVTIGRAVYPGHAHDLHHVSPTSG